MEKLKKLSLLKTFIARAERDITPVIASCVLIFAVAYHLLAIEKGFDSSKIELLIYTFFIAGAAWGCLLLRLRFNNLIVISALIALLEYLLSFHHTIYPDRAPDYWGHSAYIEYIHANWRIPNPMQGWVSYHPPLYYILAAITGQIGIWLGGELLSSARYFSIAAMLVFQCFGLLFIRRVVHTQWIATLCSVTLLFWPFFMALVGRLSNDMLLYPLWMASSYYLLCWYQEKRIKDLAISIALCAVIMLAKTSALFPIAIIGVVVIHNTVKHRIPLRNYLHPCIKLAIVLLVVATSLNFGRTIYYKLNGFADTGFIVGNFHVDPMRAALLQNAGWCKFLCMDSHILFHEPYIDFRLDSTGRQYFWHYYLKSAMYGEDTWPNPNLAIALTLSLISLVFYACITGIITRKSDEIRFFLIALVVPITIQIGSAIYYGITNSYSSRFTLPTVFIFLFLVGFLIDQLYLQGKKKLAYLGVALLSVLFILEFLFMSKYLPGCILINGPC